MEQFILKIVFFGLPVFAILPVFMPWWRWFLGSVVFFLVYAISFFIFAVNELTKPPDDSGPVVVAFVVYMGGVGLLFIISVVVKLIIVVFTRK